MSSQVIIQYATLISLVVGILGLAIAVSINRQQVTTQIFLELSAPSVARRLRSPLFVREWKAVKSEFESFPDFLDLIMSIQKS